VVLFRNYSELREHLKIDSNYDLIILDTDSFETSPSQLPSWIDEIKVPVVIHSCLPGSWMDDHFSVNLNKERQPVVIVAKENVEELKRVVKKIIALSERQSDQTQLAGETGNKP
jgi:hypothetical protein